MGFPGGASGKEPTCQCKRQRRRAFDPWVRKIPWRSIWQPIPAFLPRESHGQRSLASYGPWVAKRQTLLKQPSTHTHEKATVEGKDTCQIFTVTLSRFFATYDHSRQALSML